MDTGEPPPVEQPPLSISPLPGVLGAPPSAEAPASRGTPGPPLSPPSQLASVSQQPAIQVFTQAPLRQASSVQGESSTHSLASLQQLDTEVWTHLLSPLQVSSVQSSPSAQSMSEAQQPGAAAFTQVPVPSSQVSSVHRLVSAQSPSFLQQSGFGVWAHWLSPPQASSVQTLPSSHWPAVVQQPEMDRLPHLRPEQVDRRQGPGSAHWPAVVHSTP